MLMGFGASGGATSSSSAWHVHQPAQAVDTMTAALGGAGHALHGNAALHGFYNPDPVFEHGTHDSGRSRRDLPALSSGAAEASSALLFAAPSKRFETREPQVAADDARRGDFLDEVVEQQQPPQHKTVGTNHHHSSAAAMNAMNLPINGVAATTTPREASSIASRLLLRELSKDQQRVDEVIRLAEVLWGSGLLSVNSRRPPLLKSSLLVRLVERCYRTVLKDTMQLWWRRAALQSSMEALHPEKARSKACMDNGHRPDDASPSEQGLLLGESTSEAGLHVSAIYQDPIASDRRHGHGAHSNSRLAADASAVDDGSSTHLRNELDQARSAEAEARATAEALLEKLRDAEAAAEAAKSAEAKAREQMEAMLRGAVEVRSIAPAPVVAARELLNEPSAAVNGREFKRDIAAASKREDSPDPDESEYLRMKTVASNRAAAVIQDAAVDSRPTAPRAIDAPSRPEGGNLSGANKEQEAKTKKSDMHSIIDALGLSDSGGEGVKASPSGRDSSDDDLDSHGHIEDLLGIT
jgi:hypothetical protein